MSTAEDSLHSITILLPNTTTNTTYHHTTNTTTNLTHPHHPYDHEIPSEMVWADLLSRHYLKVICALGLPGNFAAILTIATMKPRSVATFLVALLAASDSVALVVKLIFNQLFFSLPSFNDAYCRGSYLAYFSSTYANWVLVLIASERLVAVVWPMTRNRFLRKMRVYFICALLAVPIFAIHAPMMVNSFAQSRFRCGLSGGVKEYSFGAWQVLNYLFYFLLPVGLLMGITTALGVALSRARRKRMPLLGSSVRARQTSREMQRSERAITTMMLVASFLFTMLVLPQCVYYILFRIIKGLPHLLGTPRDHLIRQTTYLLADSTHALNFYLYFISVRRFRQRVFGLLCCLGRHNGPNPQMSFSSSLSRVEKGNNNASHGCCPLTQHAKHWPHSREQVVVTSNTLLEPLSLELDSM